MVTSRKAFEIGQAIVCGVTILVMDVAPTGDRPECTSPSVSMKLFTAARIVLVTRPNAVQAAIEILRENVKDDWIGVFAVRLSADFHPLAVMNK